MTEVRYRCACMVEEAVLDVRDRLPSEDVVEWVEGPLMQVMTADHRRRSPTCQSTKTDYVKIHVPENAPSIGSTPVLDS